jgi:hypothetical protein
MVNNGQVEPEAEQPSPPPQKLGKREVRSPRDMAVSLAVLLVPIALVLAVYRFVFSGDAPVTVDPAPAIQQAQSAALFPVLVPTGLGDDWHVSSATFRRAEEGATLRLGYVAPGDDSALLVQSSIPAEQLVPTELGRTAAPRSTFRDGQRAWRGYDTRPGEIALVLTDPDRTVIVVGNTDQENLEALARSLK